jgi:hypothetical protein
VFSKHGKAIEKRLGRVGPVKKYPQVLVLKHTPLPPSRGDFLQVFQSRQENFQSCVTSDRKKNNVTEVTQLTRLGSCFLPSACLFSAALRLCGSRLGFRAGRAQHVVRIQSNTKLYLQLSGTP